MDIQLRHIGIIYFLCMLIASLSLFIWACQTLNQKPIGGVLGEEYNVKLSLITSPEAVKINTNTLNKVVQPLVKKQSSIKEKTQLKHHDNDKVNKIDKVTKVKDDISQKAVDHTVKKLISAQAIYDKKVSKIQTAQMTKGAKEAGLNGTSHITPSYIQQVLIHLQKYRYYPPLAQRRHLTGSAKMNLVLDCQGQLISYHIIHSTSVDLLDTAAIKMIKDAQPYPIPKDCKADFNIDVPIIFKLNH
ncbi:MAG: energy transducer TonB [Gammaproteobacteria bacterium]|nr:MAG: energy transducer TonB [Gammaproteobacteria bacterium]UTW42765.1 energy transducer TonB [bacterium SCSIO 12844]